MPPHHPFTAGHGVAVLLAAVGAVLFGLSSVRQHGAVQGALSHGSGGLRDHARAFVQLIRHPSWLIGSAQGAVGSLLHVVALALAPITLVQPIGVLAVPVTVAASAATHRRRPTRRQVVGAACSVGGIAVLTVLLLAPPARMIVLPPWIVVATVTAVTVVLTLVATLSSARGPRLLRCVVLATGAAVLFGLNSILLRMIGHILRTTGVRAELPLTITAAVGLCAALGVGLWAMQTAYASGTPHVVICCLTLIDPLAAVVGGRLMLQDGVNAPPGVLVAVAVCALVSAAGVVLLSADYPVEDVDPDFSAEPSRAGSTTPRSSGHGS